MFTKCSIDKEVIALINMWSHEFPTNKVTIEDMFQTIQKKDEDNKDKSNRLGVILLAFIWVLWWYIKNKICKGMIMNCNSIFWEIKTTSFWWIKSRVRKDRFLSWDSQNISPNLP